MNTIGVNISGNKTFASQAEELLTRKSQFIHQLLTELSTLANEHCAKLKRDADKQRVLRQWQSLTKSLISGYRIGVAGTEPPTVATAERDCEQTVRYLSAPYATIGYRTACMQIELMIQRGHHRSQSCKAPQSDFSGSGNV